MQNTEIKPGDRVEIDESVTTFGNCWGRVEKVDGPDVWVRLRTKTPGAMEGPWRFDRRELRVLSRA